MFEIGEIVRVIEPKLDKYNQTNGLYFNDEMRGFIGYEFRIENRSPYNDDRWYLTSIDTSSPMKIGRSFVSEWIWHESWIEKVECYEELDGEPELIELLFNEM